MRRRRENNKNEEEEEGKTIEMRRGRENKIVEEGIKKEKMRRET